MVGLNQSVFEGILNKYVYGNAPDRRQAIARLGVSECLSYAQVAQVAQSVQIVQDRSGVLVVSKLLDIMLQLDESNHTEEFGPSQLYAEAVSMLVKLLQNAGSDGSLEIKSVVEHLVLTLIRHKRCATEKDKQKLKTEVTSQVFSLESEAVVRALLADDEWGEETALRLHKW